MFFSSLRTHASAILFYFFLTLIFILEGLAWNGGRQAALALIIVMPIFLFLLDLLLHNKIALPKTSALLYGGFLAFSVLSTLFSLDRMQSLQYLLLYAAVFAVFIYVLNHQDELKKGLPPFLYSLSFFLIVYSVILRLFLFSFSSFFIPVNGYEFVFAKFGIHNHLGDFLVLPMLVCVYGLTSHKHPKLSVASFVFFLPFFLYSYSRSAYLAFLLTGASLLVWIIMKANHNLRLVPILFSVCCFLFVGVFFFATVQEDQSVPILAQWQQQVGETFAVKNKILSAHRPDFFTLALTIIAQRPLFGVGPGNYGLVSQQHVNELGFSTDSSHNLFLDIFSENGVVAGMFFVTFLGYVLWKSEKDIFFYLAVAVLINFQTDYTFRIYSFFLLFFILIARKTKKENGEY